MRRTISLAAAAAVTLTLSACQDETPAVSNAAAANATVTVTQTAAPDPAPTEPATPAISEPAAATPTTELADPPAPSADESASVGADHQASAPDASGSTAEAPAEQPSDDPTADSSEPAPSARAPRSNAATSDASSDDSAAAPAGSFDKAWAIKVAGWVKDDIDALDDRYDRGIGMSTRLGMLSTNFGRLLDEGAPPGADSVTYLANVRTLKTFAANASDDYVSGMETRGAARYTVIRENTTKLLSEINRTLGTSITLGPWTVHAPTG